MSEERVWRQESGLTAAGARETDDVVGDARKAMDKKKQDAWMKTPSRKDRGRRGNSSGSFETYNSPAAVAATRERDNGPAAVAAGRAQNGPVVNGPDQLSAEDERAKMDARKKDAWKKTPPRKDRARAR
jgi:hypothetical protein